MKITASGTRLSGVDKAFDFRGVHVASSCLSRCLDRGMVAEIKRMFVSPAARGNTGKGGYLVPSSSLPSIKVCTSR